MKELIGKQAKELDMLADELVEMVANSKKLADVLKFSKEGEALQKKNLIEINKMKNRISYLERRVDKLVRNFKTDIVESARLISEKYEDIKSENEKNVDNLQSQLGELRRALSKIKK